MIFGLLAVTNQPLLSISPQTIERATLFKLLRVYIDSSVFDVPICPSKVPLSVEGSEPSSNKVFLGPHESVPQTASRSIQPFLHSSTVYPAHTTTDNACYVQRHL